MRRLEDVRDRRGEARPAAPPELQNGTRVLTLAGSSAARGAPNDIPGDNFAQRRSFTKNSGLKHSELVWICCRYSVFASGLQRILEQQFLVHLGEDPPKGTPSSVVLYAEGAEGVGRAVKHAQDLYPNIPVLVFGPRTDLPLAEAALRSGARGFVHAEMTPEQLIRALEVVGTKGEIVAPRQLLEYLVTEAGTPTPDLDTLSPRQWEILGLVAEGLSNAEIANRLYLSESTIKQHLRATYKLLGVRNRAQAARLFRQDARGSNRFESK